MRGWAKERFGDVSVDADVHVEVESALCVGLFAGFVHCVEAYEWAAIVVDEYERPSSRVKVVSSGVKPTERLVSHLSLGGGLYC